MKGGEAQDRGEQNKKLGRLAEKEFSGWCTRADLTVNKSEEDDEGWDFFVQAKSSNAARPFLDQEPPAFTALVQVKATADAAGVVRMTLSNALKFAKHREPAFLFIARMEGGDVVDAWLLHCWEDFISRAFEVAVAAESGASLNERTLTFRPAAEDRVNRETLRAKLEELVGDTTTYGARKAKLIESVGYDDPRYEVVLRVPVVEGLDPDRQFAEFVVGARSLDGVSLEIQERRFDVARLFKRVESATIARPQNGEDDRAPSATLIFVGNDGRRAEIECKAYLASFYVPGLSESANVTRFAAPNFEFISQEVTEDRIRFDIRFPDLAAPIPPGELHDRARVARAARFIREPNVRIRLRVGAVETELRHADDVRAEPDPLPGAIDDLSTLVQQFSIPLGTKAILPERLAEAAETLSALAAIARGVGAPSEPRFALAADMPFHSGDRVTVVAAVPFRFPGALLVMIVGISGVLKLEGDEGAVEAKRARLLVGRAFPTPVVADVQELFVQGCQMLDDEGVDNVLRMFPSEQMDRLIALFQPMDSEP